MNPTTMVEGPAKSLDSVELECSILEANSHSKEVSQKDETGLCAATVRRSRSEQTVALEKKHLSEVGYCYCRHI